MTAHYRNNGSKNKGWGAVTGRPGRQKGAVTMFSAVLILILLTEMLIYAVQVGVFEQRKSGNEMRQKQAFHAAEAGIQQAHAYLLANATELTFTGVDGWLSDTASGHWVECDGAYSTGDKTHPCWGEPLGGDANDAGEIANLRDSSYFYSLDGVTPANLPIQAVEILPDSTETVAVQAILCLLDLNRTLGSIPVEGCITKEGNFNDIYFVITLLSRGQAECDAEGDCAAEALVAQKLGSFGPLTGAGAPGVPLTSRSTFPPTGNAQIVPNPNGGGTGVPISSWLNANPGPDPLCGGGVPIAGSGGSWTTCERHEWYGVGAMPDENSPNGKYTCPTANCSCGAAERLLSEPGVNGIDIVIDPLFPCDLFEYTFNVERAKYLEVKNGPGVQVITDCDELGPDSRGTIWVDGSVGTCDLSGKAVGSPEFPVFIVSAATLTKMVGNTQIYGVLLITDVEGNAAAIHAAGTNTVYGAVLVEGDISHFQGTFQIVYNDDLIERATKTGSLGKIYGGWTDFHEDWR
jgi:hypothetical protein